MEEEEQQHEEQQQQKVDIFEAAVMACTNREEYELCILRFNPISEEDAIAIEDVKGCTCNDEVFGFCKQCLLVLNIDPDYFEKLSEEFANWTG